MVLTWFIKYFSNLLAGMTKLRFKPAYNPYTEPSMEIFGYHDGKAPLLSLFIRPFISGWFW